MKIVKNLCKGALFMGCLIGLSTFIQPITVQADTYTKTYYDDTDDYKLKTETINDPNVIVNNGYAFTIKDGFLKEVEPVDVTNQSGEVIIPDGVRIIDNAIHGSHIKEENDGKVLIIKSLKIPDSVEAIDANSITNTDITELTIPKSVKYIGVSALADNKKLKTIIIEEGCTHIDMLAFTGNTALKDAYLPSTVKKMSYNWTDSNPFQGIEKKVTVHAEKSSFVYGYCKNILGMKVVDTTPVKPSKISALKVSKIKQDSMKLTWSKASKATGYYVYQKNGSSWNKMATVSKTNYTVKNLKPNKKYEFKIVAYRNNDKTITVSKGTTITQKTKAMEKPDKVTKIKASKIGENFINLTWNKSKNATSYNVYQYDNATKKWVKLDTVTKKSYRVTGLTTKSKYKFKVVAENKQSYGTKTGEAVTISAKTK